MTHRTLLLLTTGLMLAMSGAAQAAIVAEDDFSYTDGALAGKGSGSDPGWAESWRAAVDNGGSATVSGGSASVDSAYRAARNLDATIGDADDAGLIYSIRIDVEFGADDYNAFEAFSGGDAGSNRTLQLAQRADGDGGQVLWLNEASGSTTKIDFTDQSGINSYRIDLAFGQTSGDQDTAELFINGSSTAGPSNVGTGLSFDRAALAAFKPSPSSPASTLAHADNLSITIIPEPGSLTLLAPVGLLALRRRRT